MSLTKNRESQTISSKTQIPEIQKSPSKVYWVSQLLQKLHPSFIRKAVAFLQTTQRNITILHTKQRFGHI